MGQPCREGEGEPMRLALVVALALALGASAASARPRLLGSSECQWLARELVHADVMRERASQLDEKYGVDRYSKRVDYLQDHFEESCPLQAKQQKDAQEFSALVK